MVQEEKQTTTLNCSFSSSSLSFSPRFCDTNTRMKKGGSFVPQFGGWDKESTFTDYSMVFSKARQNKRQNKTEFKRAIIVDEHEHTNKLDVKQPVLKESDDKLITKGKKMRTCLTCFRG